MSEQYVHWLLLLGRTVSISQWVWRGPRPYTWYCLLLLLGCSWFPPFLPWNQASLHSSLSSVCLLIETSSFPTGGRNLFIHLIIATSRPPLVPRGDSSSSGSQRTQAWAGTSPPLLRLAAAMPACPSLGTPCTFQCTAKAPHSYNTFSHLLGQRHPSVLYSYCLLWSYFVIKPWQANFLENIHEPSSIIRTLGNEAIDGHLLNYWINEMLVCVAYLEQYCTSVGLDPSMD